LREEFGLDKPIWESRRADSNRLPLLQLRVIIQALLEFAWGCKTPISRTVPLLCLALCRTVLRSRWCQRVVSRVLRLRVAGSFAIRFRAWDTMRHFELQNTKRHGYGVRTCRSSAGQINRPMPCIAPRCDPLPRTAYARGSPRRRAPRRAPSHRTPASSQYSLAGSTPPRKKP
jgi:hypothetical protein